MMRRILLLCLLGLMISKKGISQIDSVAVRLQKIKTETEDSVRIALADEIPACLEKVEFGEYALGPVVQFLGYKKEIKEDIELFSWAIPVKGGQMFYNWFRFKEENKIYLKKSFSDERGEQPAWLYYDLIHFQNQGKTYFALLGWNKTRNTNQKIIQICHFEPNGVMNLEPRLMRKGNSRSAVLNFEYGLEGSMMLKQDKKGKRIIFDHLAPVDKKYEGYFMFYGPDASYDALVLKGGEWWYEEDVKQ